MTARISIAIVFCAARAALGQTSGAEFQVNTVTTGDQSYPAACRDPNGRAVVTWETRDPTGSKTDIRARRYDATGAPLGDAELAVNTYTADDQQLPSPACRADGSFIVVWESRTQDGDDFGIVDQRFDANGTRLGDETIVNSHTAGRQRNPALCNDAAGNFVVVWQGLDQDGDGYGVFGQRFDAAGGRRGGEFQVNTFTDHSQWHPAIACSAAGEFVVAWESGRQDGDGYGIFAQRFAADGGRLGNELRVNTTTAGTQQLPAVGADAGGNFVIAWESADGQDGDSAGIFAQRYTSAGVPHGGEFQVNAGASYSEEKPAIGMAPDGAFTVLWSSPHDGDGYGVFARQFTRAGAPLGLDVQVNQYTIGEQGALSHEGHVLAAAGGADATVVWQSIGVTKPAQDGDGAGVFARRIAPPPPCPGDCSANRAVSIDELVRGVGIALGRQSVQTCLAFDGDANDDVTVAELIAAVNAALKGCG